MNISNNHIVADCVVKNYKTATVFKKYGIDFCCGGKVSIKKACKQAGVLEKDLIEDLNKVSKEVFVEDSVEAYELDDLIDYIIKKHHSYIVKMAPEIESFLNKIVEVHGAHHPELKKIKDIYQEITGELFSHMGKEENILFPLIKELVNTQKNKNKINFSHCGTIQNPINVMEMEHEAVGNSFREIRKISNNLTAPKDACNTYKTSFALLDEFENDLHRHIHLENNILFPKAIDLEEGLLKRK